jgi:hypothetical protein
MTAMSLDYTCYALAKHPQAAVCRAVALAVGGLLEEPQMGTFRTVAVRC